MILAIIAVMLASITLLYAIGIRESEKETKEDLLQSKRDKFQYTLREFSVQVFTFEEFKFDKKRMNVETVYDSVVLMLLMLLKDLRLALNEYESKDLDTFITLRDIQNDLELLKLEEKHAHRFNLVIKNIFKDLEKIAKKYEFDPLIA